MSNNDPRRQYSQQHGGREQTPTRPATAPLPLRSVPSMNNGISRHQYSPEMIKEYLNHPTPVESCDSSVVNEELMMVNPAHYGRYVQERQRRDRRNRSNNRPNPSLSSSQSSTMEMQGRQDLDLMSPCEASADCTGVSSTLQSILPLPFATSPSALAGTFLHSTKKWVEDQHQKRQQKALEKAVQEQRQILFQESLKQKAEERALLKRMKKERERAEKGLKGNEAFLSMTNTMSQRSTGGLLLCGGPHDLEDEDEEDFEYQRDSELENDEDESDLYSEDDEGVTSDQVGYSGNEERRQNEFSEYQDSIRSLEASAIYGGDFSCSSPRDNHGDPYNEVGFDRQYHSSPPRLKVSKNGEEYRIGSPHETFSGQGMAVQLQIIEKAGQTEKQKLKMGKKRRKHRKRRDDDSLQEVMVAEEESTVPFILTKPHMKEIAKNGLPASIMFSRWKRLYSLQRDGDSFSGAFLAKVSGEERTLLVIETTKREVMGAYVNSPWINQGGNATAAFYGSAQACLFGIDQETQEVKVYKWSGSNRYIQVCDVHAKLLAFGGGGKDGEFGLCVEDDFRTGSTGPCETFANEPLCKQDRFEILNVECWGFTSGFC